MKPEPVTTDTAPGTANHRYLLIDTDASRYEEPVLHIPYSGDSPICQKHLDQSSSMHRVVSPVPGVTRRTHICDRCRKTWTVYNEATEMNLINGEAEALPGPQMVIDEKDLENKVLASKNYSNSGGVYHEIRRNDKDEPVPVCGKEAEFKLYDLDEIKSSRYFWRQCSNCERTNSTQ